MFKCVCVVNVGELCLKIKAFFRLVFFIFYFILYFLIVVVVGEQNSTTTKTVNIRKHIFNYVVRAQGFFLFVYVVVVNVVTVAGCYFIYLF